MGLMHKENIRGDRMSTIRDFGLVPGRLPAGKKNSIADVAGVKVGHWTLINETHRTGVTVILPRDEIYLHKCTAAVHVINGYGKSAGLIQIGELGQLESPVALTNTLNVGLVSDALVEYTIGEMERKGRKLRSFNPAVGECNDAGLNRITDRVVHFPQVMEAIRNASDHVLQGCIGAGAGMTCHDLKGGIGTASRVVKIGEEEYTIGILSLCNHGNLEDLTVCGKAVGKEIREKMNESAAEAGESAAKGAESAAQDGDKNGVGISQDIGSCIIVLATDLPVSARQLKRIIKRCGAGLARCGSYWGHGSGDIAIGFTTAHDIAEDEEKPILTRKILCEKYLEQAFLAAAEATEESVLNALACAEPVPGRDGEKRHALSEYIQILS